MLRSVDIERQIERGRILLEMTSCETYDSILVLSLKDLALNRVFKHIKCCTNLQVLFLSGNKIQTQDIRQHMFKLKTLRKLDLSSNELQELPSEPRYFSQMNTLEFLALDNNAIFTASDVRGLSHAKNLKYLSLENNPIQMNLQQMYRFEVASMLPHLHGLDYNCVTFDEYTYRMDNRSIRFCSMNSFSRFEEETTLVFQPELSATGHLELLNAQLKQMHLLRRSNDPLICIRMSLREAGMAKICYAILAKSGNAAKVIQKYARRWLVNIRAKNEFLKYFEQIGEIELTMTVEEAKHYRARNTLKRLLPILTGRWKRRQDMTRGQTSIGRYLRGWSVRNRLNWAMDGPLNLSENRYIVFLKEQKYLLKHIITEQRGKSLSKHAIALTKLIRDYSGYYLVKHVDLDLFDMPERAVLQIAMPPTMVYPAKSKKRPHSLRAGRSLFELCIPTMGEKKVQKKELEDLKRLKPEYSNLSSYEIQVGRLQVIPADYKKKILKLKMEKLAQDNLMASFASSNRIDQVENKTQEQKAEITDAKDKELFVKIMRREGQDFVCLDLHQAKSSSINSSKMMELLIMSLINWNRSNQVNQIHFYVGALFKRQTAIIQIQKWVRYILRVRKERRELIQHQQTTRLQSGFLTEVDLQPNQLTILRCLQLRRAAKTIQKYWSMYRLRRRIRMLANLKNYLHGVTQSTLCIEEHLYKNIQVIQCTGHQNSNESLILGSQLSITGSNAKVDGNASRRNCNTIPEAHCFAFDFVESSENNRDAELEAWDLIYTTDRKYFSAKTNQETHDAIYNRFEQYCVPDWVVMDLSDTNSSASSKDDEQKLKEGRALSLKAGFIDTCDRNNTNQIFHKTQKAHPTEILDYNQIVQPQNRTFVMNNGLRFVVIHCASVTDARRRALALAMISLDRTKGDFLKILCPNQLLSGNFMPNIKCWWELPAICQQIPKDFYNQLLQPGIQNLRELPIPIEFSYSGLILSEKDHKMAYLKEDLHSVQIQRQRNFDELRMKLVYSGEPKINSHLIPTAKKVSLLMKIAKSQNLKPDSSSKMLIHQNNSQRQQVQFQQQNYLSTEIEINQDDSSAATLAPPQYKDVALHESTIAIDVHQLGGDTSDEHSQLEARVIMGRNYEQSLENSSTVKFQDKIESAREPQLSSEHAANQRTQTLTGEVSPQKNAQVINQQHIVAQKSKQVLLAQARAATSKPLRDESTKTRAAQMSTTTKADSLICAPPKSVCSSLVGALQTISSMQGEAKSTSMFTVGDNSSTCVQQKRVKSGLGVRMKQALQTQQSTYMMKSDANISQAVTMPESFTKIVGSQKLFNRRPKTSLANIKKMNDYGQQHQQSKVLTDSSKSKDLGTLRENPLQPQEIKTFDSVVPRDTFRIRSSIFNRQTNNSQTADVTVSVNCSGRSRQRLHESDISRLRRSQQQMMQSSSIDYCLPQQQDAKEAKNLDVSKQRIVSHLMSNSINLEKEKRLQLIQTLGYHHKKQNTIKIAEREQKDIKTKSLLNKQRAQSSVLSRFKNQQNKAQKQKISGCVNMLNKIAIEKMLDHSKSSKLQSTQSKTQPLASLRNEKLQRIETLKSETSIVTAQRQTSQPFAATPEIYNIDTRQFPPPNLMDTCQQLEARWQPLIPIKQISIESLHNGTNIVTQRLEPISQHQQSQGVMMMNNTNITPRQTMSGDSGRGNYLVRNVVMSKQSSSTQSHDNAYKETLLNDQQQHQLDEGINFRHVNSLPLNLYDYDDLGLTQHQQTWVSQAPIPTNLSQVAIPNFDMQTAAYLQQQLTAPSFLGNPDQNYHDFLNQKHEPAQLQFSRVPIKKIQQHHNKDIQSDLVHSAQQLTYQKQLSQQSQQSSQKSYKAQQSQKIPIALPVTMKEYQLQLQGKKSNCGNSKKSTRRQ